MAPVVNGFRGHVGTGPDSQRCISQRQRGRTGNTVADHSHYPALGLQLPHFVGFICRQYFGEIPTDANLLVNGCGRGRVVAGQVSRIISGPRACSCRTAAAEVGRTVSATVSKDTARPFSATNSTVRASANSCSATLASSVQSP